MITDDDNFINLSSSAQALYMHLVMSADDEGFTNAVTICLFKAHATADDYNSLLQKHFIIQFNDGVIVITAWNIMNTVQKDRFHATGFTKQREMVEVKSGVYQVKDDYVSSLDTSCIHDVSSLETEVNLNKSNISKSNKYINTLAQSDYKPEPKKPPKTDHPAKDTSPVLYANTEPLPLTNGKDWRPTEEDFEEMRRLYPAVDIYQEFRNMKGWISSNPNRKKTEKGIKRFVNNWLSRNQNRGQTKPAADNNTKKGFDFSDYYE